MKKEFGSEPNTVAAYIYSEVFRPVIGLGFKLNPEWRYGCFCDAAIHYGRVAVARLELRVHERHFDLNIHPVDPASIKLIGHYPSVRLFDRGPPPEREYLSTREHLADCIEDLESKFRALLVSKGKLPRKEFATDAKVKAWLAAVVAAPSDSEASYSGVAKRDATALLASYDRADAISFMRKAADEPGHYVAETDAEQAHQNLSRVAAIALDTRLERMETEWKRQSFIGWLLPSAEVDEPTEGQGPSF